MARDEADLDRVTCVQKGEAILRSIRGTERGSQDIFEKELIPSVMRGEKKKATLRFRRTSAAKKRENPRASIAHREEMIGRVKQG